MEEDCRKEDHREEDHSEKDCFIEYFVNDVHKVDTTCKNPTDEVYKNRST